ncbi:MAG TPA: Rho termination factor N-terminal domain-containing protein [Solirubrobacteraceae bacterium]|nr:Rho termination factor N-terminal domain-containing protein [Solirubrobacteraceae bacterium]
MSVLDRSALEASPLADLHAIASELSIDGYRRLRKAQLIDAILTKQEGGEPAPAPEPASAGATGNGAPAAEAQEPAGGRRRRRSTAADEDEETGGGRRRRRSTAADEEDEEPTGGRRRRPAATGDEDEEPGAGRRRRGAAAEEEDEESGAGRRRRGRRGGRGRGATGRDEAEAPEREAAEEEAEPAPGEEMVEGVVELLANGSGFVRVDPPEPSDDDVYISSAQVKRCELVSGDRIAGPKRAPRRSERFASLIRIETINSRPAAELADSVRFDDLPAAFPSERIKVGSDDATLKAIELLTPFGKGSRVTITGAARAGKTEVLRRLAQALAGREELSVSVVLAGVRPEEISEWNGGASAPVAPAAAVSFAASEDARNAAIEPAIDQARRLAARGADAVVLIDTLDGCSPHLARKALAAARNIVDGGSLTVIATAAHPVGGETTVIALDARRTSLGRFPALDLPASGTMRPELLVGDAAAQAITRSRAEAAEGGA